MSSVLQASVYLIACREGVNVISLILGKYLEWIQTVSAARREILGNPIWLDRINHSLELLLCCLTWRSGKYKTSCWVSRSFQSQSAAATPVPLSYHTEWFMTWSSMEPVVLDKHSCKDQLSLVYDPSKPTKFHLYVCSPDQTRRVYWSYAQDHMQSCPFSWRNCTANLPIIGCILAMCIHVHMHKLTHIHVHICTFQYTQECIWRRQILGIQQLHELWKLLCKYDGSPFFLKTAFDCELSCSPLTDHKFHSAYCCFLAPH